MSSSELGPGDGSHGSPLCYDMELDFHRLPSPPIRDFCLSPLWNFGEAYASQGYFTGTTYGLSVSDSPQSISWPGDGSHGSPLFSDMELNFHRLPGPQIRDLCLSPLWNFGEAYASQGYFTGTTYGLSVLDSPQSISWPGDGSHGSPLFSDMELDFHRLPGPQIRDLCLWNFGEAYASQSYFTSTSDLPQPISWERSHGSPLFSDMEPDFHRLHSPQIRDLCLPPQSNFGEAYASQSYFTGLSDSDLLQLISFLSRSEKMLITSCTISITQSWESYTMSGEMWSLTHLKESCTEKMMSIEMSSVTRLTVIQRNFESYESPVVDYGHQRVLSSAVFSPKCEMRGLRSLMLKSCESLSLVLRHTLAIFKAPFVLYCQSYEILQRRKFPMFQNILCEFCGEYAKIVVLPFLSTIIDLAQYTWLTQTQPILIPLNHLHCATSPSPWYAVKFLTQTLSTLESTYMPEAPQTVKEMLKAKSREQTKKRKGNFINGERKTQKGQGIVSVTVHVNGKEVKVTLETLQQLYGRSLQEAAECLGVSRSTTKRICRKIGITRWPSNRRKKTNSFSHSTFGHRFLLHSFSHSTLGHRFLHHTEPEMLVGRFPSKKSTFKDLEPCEVDDKQVLDSSCLPSNLALNLDKCGEDVAIATRTQTVATATSEWTLPINATLESTYMPEASQTGKVLKRKSREQTKKRKGDVKVGERKTQKGQGNVSVTVLGKEDQVTQEIVQQLYGRSLQDAAECLGVSRSTFKRICRKFGITRWPSNKRKKPNSFSHSTFGHGSLHLTQPAMLVGRFPNNKSTFKDLELWEAEDKQFLDSSGLPLNLALNLEKCGENVAIAPKSETAATATSECTLPINARYQQNTIKFLLHFPLKMTDLEKELVEMLNLKLGTFMIKYLDTENDWILMACDDDLQDLMVVSRSTCDGTIQMIVQEKP